MGRRGFFGYASLVVFMNKSIIGINKFKRTIIGCR